MDNRSQSDRTEENNQGGHEPGSEEFMYPERPGEPDCSFYMRVGSCRYGMNCRFNHPHDRSLVGGAVSYEGEEHPERPEEPSCQFYLRTGTCKYGPSCKFHHPRYIGVSTNFVQTNSYGYPSRQGEKECSYYMKTGICKYGITCKFHHPQPSDISIQEPILPLYSTVQSSVNGYRPQRPQLLANWFGQGAYSPLFPPGVVPTPGWSPYSGILGSVLSSSAPSITATYFPLPFPSGQRLLPQRPGQPRCKYYLKTGNCKFGSSCKYHHPSDSRVSTPL